MADTLRLATSASLGFRRVHVVAQVILRFAQAPKTGFTSKDGAAAPGGVGGEPEVGLEAKGGGGVFSGLSGLLFGWAGHWWAHASRV